MSTEIPWTTPGDAHCCCCSSSPTLLVTFSGVTACECDGTKNNFSLDEGVINSIFPVNFQYGNYWVSDPILGMIKTYQLLNCGGEETENENYVFVEVTCAGGIYTVEVGFLFYQNIFFGSGQANSIISNSNGACGGFTKLGTDGNCTISVA